MSTHHSNMSTTETNPILARTSPRIKRSVLPASVPVQSSNGYGTKSTRHPWTREENRLLMTCYYNSKPHEKGFMRRMEEIWHQKRPGTELDMKQLNNQRYSIMKKHLLSDLELEELQRPPLPSTTTVLAPPPTPPSQTNTEVTDEINTIRAVEQLELPDDDTRTLRQSIIDQLTTEQGNRHYLHKLRYDLTDETLHQVNTVLETIPTSTITETNALIYATIEVLQERLGMIRQPSTKPHNAWQIRLENKIKQARSDVSKLCELVRGHIRRDKIPIRYRDMTVKEALETAKQRLVALSARLKRYTKEAESRNINRLFSRDASKVYNILKGDNTRQTQLEPPKAETELYWKNIWERDTKHNEKAQWLNELRRNTQRPEQQPVTIDEDDLCQRVKRMKNWTAPGPDMIHAYWLKKLTALHRRLAQQMDNMIADGDHPEWLTQGRTVLIMKDSSKGAIPSNYRPITCLSTTWKLLSGILADKIQDHMGSQMHNAQKGIGGGSRGSKHQLLIDQTVTKDSKGRRTNLAMAWIDYKKAYDSIPHSWILQSLKIYKVNSRIVTFIQQSMMHWQTTLSANSNKIADIKIKCGIYQGDALSPLLFCIALNPLSELLDNSEYGYKFSSGTKINHLLYMDDIKLYAKNQRDIDSLIHLTRVFSNDIGMTFGLEKCGRLIISRGKVQQTSGVSMPQGRIDDIAETYKYLGIMQSFRNQDEEMRSKATTEYRNRVRRVLQSQLSSRNKITAINAFAVPVIRYPAAVITWRQEDLKAADIGTRKLMTLHGIYHPKSSTGRLYTSRKEGGRGLHSIADIVKAEEQSLKSYVNGRAETDELMKECQRLIANWEPPQDKEPWYDKPLHGAWHNGVAEVADMRKTYQWLTRSNIKANTEALIMAAQEQALNTRAIACQIYHTTQNPMCRMCNQHSETVAHLISGCSKLAATDYTNRHNQVASLVYRAICTEYDLEYSKDWRVEPEKVILNDSVKLLWDFSIQTDIKMPHNRPDIVLINNKNKKGYIIDIAVPRDENIKEKELEKIDKYQPLRIELERLWNVKISVIPVVVGALGAIASNLEDWLGQIPGTISEVELQKSAILGTAKTLRRVLRLPGLW